MTKNEKETLEYSLAIEKGILLLHSDFKNECSEPIKYDFDCPEYEELKSKYKLEKIAGKGSDYIRAKRLLNYFSPRLKHRSDYDNHVECNALALLEYSFEKPENGINCLNKSKIFSEVCLAVGIKARRIVIYPYSPYDCDNHVVAEIFDREADKWIMMDPTTQGIFIDGNKTPLSMLEIRSKFADNEFVTFVKGNAELDDIDINKLKDRNLERNWYICKNSFRFSVRKYQGFGSKPDDWIDFVPVNYSVKKYEVENIKYRMDIYSKYYPTSDMPDAFKEWYDKALASDEPRGYSIAALD